MALAQPQYPVNPSQSTRTLESLPNTKLKEKERTIPKEVVRTASKTFLLMSLSFLVLIGVMTVLASMLVANKNRQLQDIQTQTSQLQKENDALLQKVQEYSQYDRVMEIAQKQGLEMNEANVRNVGQ